MPEKEIWKPVVGFEGCYEISNMGRLKGVARWITDSKGRSRFLDGGIISLYVCKNNGYKMRGLSKNGERKYATIHRLVAEAFVPKVPGKEYINHKNGVKTDNRAENLEWTDKRGNALHAVYHLKKTCGAEAQAVLCVEDDIVFESMADAARAYSIGVNNIHIALKKETNTCMGKHWRRVTIFSPKR